MPLVELTVTILLLAAMEVSLSFDNAVMNASVLKHMEPKWRKRFIFWGCGIAIVGTRLLAPALIVSCASGLSLLDVGRLALTDPAEYSRHITGSRPNISAFGGMFLLMVFLHFGCDPEKEVHWIGWLERALASLGRIDWIAALAGVMLLIGMLVTLPPSAAPSLVLSAGLGIATFMGLEMLTGLLGDSRQPSGLLGFLYLELLDASLSLDGIVGAFALSSDIVIIMVGLGIGAFFVRSLTVAMVNGRTLEGFIYLEHGAHYGVGALGALMLAGLYLPVPEAVTGCAGVALIGLSLLSSIKHNRKESRHA